MVCVHSRLREQHSPPLSKMMWCIENTQATKMSLEEGTLRAPWWPLDGADIRTPELDDHRGTIRVKKKEHT